MRPGKGGNPGFLVSTPHRGREGLQPGDAVMGDPGRFLTLRVSVWHRWSRHPCMQRALRSLPVPRARRGEGLPAVSPQGDAFVFWCCEGFLRVPSVPTVLGREEEMKLCCHLQSRHLSVSPIKAGGRDFPGGPVVMTSPSKAGGVGSIPGEGPKIPHASQPKNQSIKQKQCCSKFSKDFKKGLHQKAIFFLKKSRRYKVALKWFHFADCRVSSLDSSQRGRKPAGQVSGWRQEVGSHGWTSMWAPSLEEPGSCTFCCFFRTHDCGAWVLGVVRQL